MKDSMLERTPEARPDKEVADVAVIGLPEISGMASMGAVLVATLNPAPAGPATTIPLIPDGTQLPGTRELHQLTNGIAEWALIAALIGILVGAAAWGLGHYSQNYHQSYNGRKGLLVSAAAALVIGAAPAVVDFFLRLGGNVGK
jgi:hypothetical protein